MSGALFVFEGIDGAGKSTISAAVAQALAARGRAVTLRSFPGREEGTLGALVYGLHHAPADLGVSAIAPAALQLLHVAAHLDAIERDIVPRLRNGETVLLDRYWWSTWAYGVASGTDPDVLRRMINLERCCWAPWAPTAVFLVERGKPGSAYLKQVNEAYLALSESEPNVVRVDNSGDLATTLVTVLSAIWTRDENGSTGRV